MQNKFFSGVAVLAAALTLGGCAADLSSGNKFSKFVDPPSDKSMLYLIRDENIMAAKLPYMVVSTAKSDGKDRPVSEFTTRAIVGKDMFVPILMDPGYYMVKTGTQTEMELKAGEINCAEVGGKYRGVTIYTVEPVDLSSCRKMLDGKDQGVDLEEAKKRSGLK